MKTSRFIAAFLFQVTRILSILYLATATYLGFILVFTISKPPGWLPLKIEESRFEIYYPFTQKPFLLGDYTPAFLTIILATTLGYGIFLWLLSNVFKTFRQQKLFTPEGVNRLSLFYMMNFIAPLAILIVLAFMKTGISEMIVITCLHFVIGIFAYFMAAIFRQGLLLQEEQDLTL